MLKYPSTATPGRKRLANAVLYSVMALIVLGLILLLHLVSSIQDARSPSRRWELARRVIYFQLPESYELTSALYALHPHFFVLTHVETGQKIRVMERRWWTKVRTPEEFRKKFHRLNEWVDKPAGFGYPNMLVKSFGEVKAENTDIPYAIGLFGSKDRQHEEGLVACFYDPESRKSIFVMGTAPAGVFNATETLHFLTTLSFEPIETEPGAAILQVELESPES